ncbi:tetratricopeptide repeat protein [Hallella colorans]|uniref:tetratricopeptide repeat protein n=1 Tax=Hallella colorans TaxID=1703337 RepID=UPI0023F39B2D|nr:tetratricopeptide repeat protein [Hallella colorans]
MANNKEQATYDVASKSEAFFQKYAKPVLNAAVAVVIVFAGIFCYKSFIRVPLEVKSNTAIDSRQDYFNADQFDKALNGDGAGYVGFLSIASDYSNTDAGNLAKLYAGLSYANLGKWKEAVDYLEDYSPADDAMVSPAAIQALGNAYAHIGEIDKAINKLKSAAERADKKSENGINNSLSPTFLLQAGQLLESQNKKEEALNLYESIKSKYVNSMLVQSQEIDKYIERVKQ